MTTPDLTTIKNQLSNSDNSNIKHPMEKLINIIRIYIGTYVIYSIISWLLIFMANDVNANIGIYYWTRIYPIILFLFWGIPLAILTFVAICTLFFSKKPLSNIKELYKSWIFLISFGNFPEGFIQNQNQKPKPKSQFTDYETN